MKDKKNDDPEQNDGQAAEDMQVSDQIAADHLHHVGESGNLDMEIPVLHDGDQVFDFGNQIGADIFIHNDDDVGGTFVVVNQEAFPKGAADGVLDVTRAVADAFNAADGIKAQ